MRQTNPGAEQGSVLSAQQGALECFSRRLTAASRFTFSKYQSTAAVQNFPFFIIRIPISIIQLLCNSKVASFF